MAAAMVDYPPVGIDSEDGEKRSPLVVSSMRGVVDLPDLTDRIDALGLSQEYSAFRERYIGWRMGGSRGAPGEITQTKPMPQSDGFGHWYPTMRVWQWRRTLSYWIAVTFFEGSLFFTISSFLWCYPERLGTLKSAVTTHGYLAGKANFLICTYLMCIETINLTSCAGHGKHSCRTLAHSESELSSSEESDAEAEEESFRLWPFNFQTALANLEKLGAGPWPYYASAVYLVGVLSFGVGLAAEFTPGLSEEVVEWTKLVSFLLGSLLFVLGGLAECVENGVFESFRCDTGAVGALLNLIGGLFFLAGAICGFFDGHDFETMFLYGLGSLVFAFGSAAMIVMWKDEQFGLTFLAVLNNLGGPNGRPIVRQGSMALKEETTFSWRGAIFIMIYCLAATLSVYNFNISIHYLWIDSANSTTYIIERSINYVLPCIFAHMLLALNSAVVRTPTSSPFHQLYIACRWLAVLMVVNSGARLVDALIYAQDKRS